jgi:hypothetical protein
MKYFITILIALISSSSFASTACSDLYTQTHIARDAVKSLIALADVPNVETYYGGTQGEDNGQTIVNIQPCFQYTKDWYKVTIRNSDCRVTNVTLFLEKLPRD